MNEIGTCFSKMNKDIETMHYNISTLMNQGGNKERNNKNYKGYSKKSKGSGGLRVHKKIKK